MRDIFITGIDTDVGKTITSAVFVEALGYDYWKPIQCGSLDNSDTMVVRSLIQHPDCCIHEEAYRFSQAASPNIAARDNKIEFAQIRRPQTENALIIEGAGGLLVPLNEAYYIVDLIKKLDCMVVLVSKNYIGSINHTLSALEVLESRNLSVFGIVFNGVHEPDIETSILERCSYPKLLHIFEENELNSSCIKKYASELRRSNEFKKF